MKTVSKKLLSLMLVAIMLFAAIPFQAFAASAIYSYQVVVETEDGTEVAKTTSPVTFDAALTAEYNPSFNEAKDVLTKAKLNVNLVNDNTAGAYRFVEGGLDNGKIVIVVAQNAASNTPAETPSTTAKEYTVRVGLMPDDKIIESGLKITLTDEAYKALGNNTDSARKVLKDAGSKYAASYADKNFYSVMKSGNEILVYVKDMEAGAPESNTQKVKITVDTGNGTYTIDAYVGQKYKDLLSAPARPGQEFLGWSSSVDGAIGDATAVSAEANGSTVTALWASATKYTITFVDKRGTTQEVYKGKQVAYGSALGELPTPSAYKGYVFKGWKINGKFVDEKTVYEWQGDVTAYAEWALADDSGKPINKQGKVYLEIYINDNTKTVEKRVDITSYAADDKITRSEVETVVKKYITAKSGYSLKLTGLFDEEGWFNYTHDPETKGEAEIVVNRDGDDYIYVMVNNVKTVAKDTTNPKTGDTAALGAAAVILVLSAGALTTTTMLKKKSF